MANFNLTQVVNTDAIPVKDENLSTLNPFWFGERCNLFPNYPRDNSKNPFYLGTNYQHKQFGSICVGRNNVAYFVTRVAEGHGISGGNLYWSKSYNEGKTWKGFTKFAQDQVSDPATEDMRDCNLYYDALIDKYFLIYFKCTDIVNHTDYSNHKAYLYVWIGDEPFVDMVDISPGIIKTDGVIDGTHKRIATFETLHRIGKYLYLPCYYGQDNPRTSGSLLIRFLFNDSLPFDTKYQKWETVKKWDADGNNETTMFVTYNNTNSLRINILSRRSDMGYLSYSDDEGVTWSEMSPIGIEIAGGPRVFELNNGYMLVAREQTIEGLNSVFAMFSSDGHTWEHRIKIDDTSSGYASLAKFRSGKTLLCYSQEYVHIGLQIARQMFSAPI